MRAFMLLLGALAIGLVGCGKPSPPGGHTESKEGSFSLVVPRMTTVVKQAEQDEVSISIDRGEEFAPEVKVKIEPPAGVTAKPEEFTFKQGTDIQKVALEASTDAPVGKHAVKVTGNPAEGESTSTTFEIEVAEKGSGTIVR